MYCRFAHHACIQMLMCAAVALLQGCSSPSGTIDVETPVRASGAYQVLAIDVSCDIPEASDQAVIDHLNGGLVARLRSGNKFGKVYSISATTETQSDLKLIVYIKSVRSVSTTQRAWVGMLSGPGSIDADVNVVDTKTSESLGSAIAHGKSSNGAFIGTQGTTREAIEQIVEQIALFVEQVK